MQAKRIEKCVDKGELLPLQLKGHIALVKIIISVILPCLPEQTGKTLSNRTPKK